jgi:PEP-CTERM motif
MTVKNVAFTQVLQARSISGSQECKSNVREQAVESSVDPNFILTICKPRLVDNNMISRVCVASALVLSVAMASPLFGAIGAPAYINEIYFDPPHSPDYPNEYIELRGTPGASLANHYLIFLENEDTYNHTGQTGQIETIFDLGHAMGGGAASFGTNGFLTLRDKNSPYSVAPGTTDLKNTGSGNGFGSGLTSSIGATNQLDTGAIENSGFTAMLIRNDSGAAPTLGMPLDGMVDNDGDPMTPHDGLDYATGQPGWTILDSIGIYSDPQSIPDAPGEAVFGRTYAPVNIGPDLDGTTVTYLDSSAIEHTITFHPNLSPGQVYQGLGYETEFAARYGNSTGQTTKDWHVANLTDNPASGYVSNADGLRQSGSDPHGFPRPDGSGNPTLIHESESNQYVPYGTNLNNTLGAANYPLNQALLPWDYNHDGVVDAADYTIWRDTLGQTDPNPGTTPLAANADRDSKVDITDYQASLFHFGESLPGPGSASGGGTVPEPASFVLAIVGLALVASTRVWRR